MNKNVHESHYSSWAEIDLAAIKQNYRAIQSLARRQFVLSEQPPHRRLKNKDVPLLLPVIKADAYGHGMLKVAAALRGLRVKYFAVSDIQEAMELRKNGFKQKILLLESTLPSLAKRVVDFDLTPGICTMTLASSLNTYARSVCKKIDVHVQIDTGMGRLGVWHVEAQRFVKQVMRYPYLSVTGLMTHFPVADTNTKYTRQQLDMVYDLISRLDHQGMIVPYVHAANSMGLAGYKTHILNLVRPGLMLYGLYPADKLKNTIKLKPAMSVKARVIFVKSLTRGRGVSYGHTFVAPRDMTVATLPVGYSNGYHRSLSNKAAVLIQGKRCPVVGRVTMDQIMVDVSRVPRVRLGTEAVIMGRQKNAQVKACELAGLAGTIPYELLCSLGNQLPRVYKS